MIISKTPLRISFFGGGTDYPQYYEAHGGEVINTTIDQYVYVTVSRLSPFFDYNIRVAYSKTELVKSVDEVQHPSVRHCLRHMGVDGGVEVSVTSDLPARSGLGSSSAFTVGLLHALHAFTGRLISQEKLAREAIYVEQKVIRERVGSQDQVAVAMGGFRHVTFGGSNGFRADPVPVTEARKRELNARLMLFFTGTTRLANDILKEQEARTEANKPNLQAMRKQVGEARDILCDPGRSLDDFGALLHEGWQLKRGLSSKVSTDTIDRAYAAAREAGALGGKLLGAGGGGFLLVYAAPEHHAGVASAVAPFMQVPFAFEDEGTRLIYHRQ